MKFVLLKSTQLDVKSIKENINSHDIVFLTDTHQIYCQGRYFPDFKKTDISIEQDERKSFKDISVKINNVGQFLYLCSISELSNGTHAIQMIHGTDIYSGVFSYTNSGSDEIILHKAGSGDNRLYLQTSGSDLQIGADKTGTVSVTINTRKLI